MSITANPQQVIDFFHAIEQIPRGSGNEQAVSDWLVAFAKERNLEVTQDAANNVIIKKPATPGYEDRPTVILQGHVDMVCEKNPGSTHDFMTDPIELEIKGDWLHAKETTLGADNAIAIAMILAILDSDDIEHGPLEFLATTSEETGMDGALAVDGSLLSGTYLLNLDTENEGEFIVSCAGGCRLDLSLDTNRRSTPERFDTALTVSIDGLSGGHSGIEIHKQRANANQLLSRALFELGHFYDFALAGFSGGSKHNAIPRQADATIVAAATDLADVKSLLSKVEEHFKAEFAPQDADVRIVIAQTDRPDTVMSDEAQRNLLSFLYVAPHGVIGMSRSLDNLVETSLNLAIVTDNVDTIDMRISLRSLSVSPLEYLKYRMLTLATTYGFKAAVEGGYPAWEYEPGSELEKQAVEIYEKVSGVAPAVTAVHAGLECGLLKEKLPNTQMISFGPTIENAHTPQERLHLPSTERIYEYLKVLLKELR